MRKYVYPSIAILFITAQSFTYASEDRDPYTQSANEYMKKLGEPSEETVDVSSYSYGIGGDCYKIQETSHQLEELKNKLGSLKFKPASLEIDSSSSELTEVVKEFKKYANDTYNKRNQVVGVLLNGHSSFIDSNILRKMTIDKKHYFPNGIFEKLGISKQAKAAAGNKNKVERFKKLYLNKLSQYRATTIKEILENKTKDISDKVEFTAVKGHGASDLLHSRADIENAENKQQREEFLSKNRRTNIDFYSPPKEVITKKKVRLNKALKISYQRSGQYIKQDGSSQTDYFDREELSFTINGGDTVTMSNKYSKDEGLLVKEFGYSTPIKIASSKKEVSLVQCSNKKTSKANSDKELSFVNSHGERETAYYKFHSCTAKTPKGEFIELSEREGEEIMQFTRTLVPGIESSLLMARTDFFNKKLRSLISDTVTNNNCNKNKPKLISLAKSILDVQRRANESSEKNFIGICPGTSSDQSLLPEKQGSDELVLSKCNISDSGLKKVLTNVGQSGEADSVMGITK